MIKRLLRPALSWLTARLDHIAAGIDQLLSETTKSSDPTIMLALRDSVTLVGSSVSRLETTVSEAWLANEPAWRFRDALVVLALDDLAEGSTVVIVGDTSAVEVVSVVRSLGMRVVVVDPLAVDSVAALTPHAAAVAIVGTGELDRLWTDPNEAGASTPAPARLVVGLALDDESRDDATVFASIARRLGWAPEELALLAASAAVRIIRRGTGGGNQRVLSAVSK